jgi:hypothetical protein
MEMITEASIGHFFANDECLGIGVRQCVCESRRPMAQPRKRLHRNLAKAANGDLGEVVDEGRKTIVARRATAFCMKD